MKGIGFNVFIRKTGIICSIFADMIPPISYLSPIGCKNKIMDLLLYLSFSLDHNINVKALRYYFE